jgi:ADP-ribose pyrophosphatase YjhB (NUDIX family)
MGDRPWTRVSAHGLCVVEDRVLLVRLAPPLAEAGRWGLPGGGLEWGESPEQALIREFREETGLDASIHGIAGVYSNTYMRSADRPLDSLHFISVLYWVQTAEGRLVHELDGTTDHAAWVPLGEIDMLPLGDLATYGLDLLQQRRVS